MKKFVFALSALFLTACGSGGGGSSPLSAVDPDEIPDFTPRTYVLRVLGSATPPLQQTVTLTQECNIGAGAPSYRNETANFSIPDATLGGIGCANIYNVEFTVNNTSLNPAQWFVFVDYGSGEVQLATGFVMAGQIQQVFKQGYVIP